MREGKFVIEWENPATGEFLEHWNGIPWHNAPRRRKMHRCCVWSRSYYQHPQYGPMHVEKCPCGAVNLGAGWFDRYSRVN